MTSLKDAIAAKNELSGSLLRTRAHGRTVAMAAAHTIQAARKNAGRNVHGVGVARKIENGKQTEELCVRICVVQKLPESRVPTAARLPKEIDGVQTDVVELASAHFHLPPCSAMRTSRQRPIVGGISAAHYLVNLATLGCFCRSVRRGESRGQYMLGCNHAFANLNSGALGDRILQPSPGDGGGSARDGDSVGKLARFMPINMDGSTPNRVDAAIAAVLPAVPVRNEICTIGPLKGIRQAQEQMPVRKHGRTSGYTEGKVISVNFDWLITYASVNFAYFVDQIYIEPTRPFPIFGKAGDSGSVVVAKGSPHAVGLYFAGAPDGSFGIANRIEDVCRALRISIP